MPDYAGPERRNFARVNCDLQVNCRPSGTDSDYEYSRTENISLSGMLLRAEGAFERTEALELIVRMPYSYDGIPIKGEVVWVKPIPDSLANQIGVRFLWFDPTLEQFIREKSLS